MLLPERVLCQIQQLQSFCHDTSVPQRSPADSKHSQLAFELMSRPQLCPVSTANMDEGIKMYARSNSSTAAQSESG